MSGKLVVVLGAPGTGKTRTVQEVVRMLQARGIDAVAATSANPREIEAMQATHGIVMLDAGPSMSANDASEIASEDLCLSLCRRASIRMLMSLDLDWIGEGVSAVGSSCGQGALRLDPREHADSLIRAALQDAGLSYAVVAGHGGARIEHALSLIDHLLDEAARVRRMKDQGGAMMTKTRWRWFCDDCGDGDCEQHWLPRHGAASDA